MRVVFMGTPEFAVPSLRALAGRYQVLSVYTRPDAASGRGRSLRPSPVKQTAAELGIPMKQPTTLRDSDVWAELVDQSPDVVIVAAYGMILPREVLEIPRLGCLNVHASLLPRWRGAAPVQRSILAGDTETGVSIMRMEEGLDTGPYCTVLPVEIGEMGTSELTSKLAQLGAEALMQALVRLEDGTCEWTPQDESAVTYAAKISKDDVALSPDLSVKEALRRVRASGPQAPARIVTCGRGVTVVSACSSDTDIPPGSVACTKDAFLLGLADGTLSVLRAKADGKVEMEGCAWARGSRLPEDSVWAAAR